MHCLYVLSYRLTKRRECIIGLKSPPLHLLLGVEHYDMRLGFSDGDVHYAVVHVPPVAPRELLPDPEFRFPCPQI